MIIQGSDKRFYKNPILKGVIQKTEWCLYWEELLREGIFMIEKKRQTTEKSARATVSRFLRVLGLGRIVKQSQAKEEKRLFEKGLVTAFLFQIELKAPIGVTYIIHCESCFEQEMIPDLCSQDIIIFELEYTKEEIKEILSGKKICPLFKDKRTTGKEIRKQVDFDTKEDLIFLHSAGA